VEAIYNLWMSDYCIWGGVGAVILLIIVFFVLRNMRRDED
jgi:hypothetical protein